jgi:hypothetical protein
MSNYFDKNFNKNISRDISGTEIFQSNVDDETIKSIFANIANTTYLFDKITPDINLNFTDENNNSVVHLLLKVDQKAVSEETKINLLKFFLEHNAPLNTYNKEKLTPLHIAILNGESQIVEFLLKQKVNINAPTNNNLNPLFLALKNNVKMCPDLIIPKDINKDEKKDENEFRNEVNKIVLELLFDKNKTYKDSDDNDIKLNKYFEYLEEIFKDFIEGKNYNKENIDGIVNMYKESIKNSESSAQKLQNKYDLELFDKYVKDLKNEFKNISDSNLDEDEDFQSYDINVDIDRIKKEIDEDQIKIREMYDKKVLDLKKIYSQIENYIKKYFTYFKFDLFLLSKYPIDAGIYNIFYWNNHTILIFDIDGYRLDEFTFNYLNNYEFPNITKLINDYIIKNNYNSEIISKFNNHHKILKVLFNLSTFIDLLDINSFNYPSDIISYKFILLNYLKICEIINIIINIKQNFESISLDINNNNLANNKNLYLTENFMLNNFFNYQLNINDNKGFGNNQIISKDNFDRLQAILNYTDNNVNNNSIDEIKLYFWNQGINLYDINTSNFSLENYKNCKSSDLIQILNNINNNKYTLQFIHKNNFITDKSNLNIKYFSELYFNVPISSNNNNIQFFELYYKGQINDSETHEYDVIEEINIKKEAGKIIFAIADNDNEYNYPSMNNEKFKLFSESDEQDKIKIFNNNFIFGKNNIARNRDCELKTINKDPILILKKLLIQKIFIILIKKEDIANGKYKIHENLKTLLDKYNPAKLDEDEFKSVIASFINNIVNEYIDSAKKNSATQILKTKFKDTSLVNYDLFVPINIKDVVASILQKDYSKKTGIFINEADKISKQFYNFNYNSNDEAYLCYNNNVNIIKQLLNNSQTNYFDTDKSKNTILHYLCQIENYNFFKEIYFYQKNKLKKFKNSPNINGITPVELINNKINKNNVNFYMIKGKKVDENELLFSKIFSSALLNKLKNTNEINKLIPHFIENIYNDLFVIFNNDFIIPAIPPTPPNPIPSNYSKTTFPITTIDIFENIQVIPETINSTKKTKSVRTTPRILVKHSYDQLFEQFNKIDEFKKTIKNNKWNIRDTSDLNLNINKDLYKIIQFKHEPKRKLSENIYYSRFWNSIAHVITLHFSTVFYDMIYDLIKQNENNIIGVPIPTPALGTTQSPTIDEILNEFKNSVFKFDPTYENGKRNLAQEIILYIYKIKYSSEIKDDKQISDLDTILKLKLKKILTLNSNKRDIIWTQQIDKIIMILKALFETFNKDLVIFLNNYVKFIELQYNLQEIRNAL